MVRNSNRRLEPFCGVAGAPFGTETTFWKPATAAQHLLERGRPAGSAGRIALPVAGDDVAAKAIVLRLVDELRLDGVDAGGLEESWRQQPGTPVYATDLDAEGVRRTLAAASKDRGPEWRGNANSPGTFATPA
jgi:hypothetical protein